MRIASYFNVTEEEIKSKQYNIWIGISLGNKFFTKENIEQYILWAIDNTKDDVLVVIADLLYSVNLEVLDHKSPQQALQKAIRMGDEKYQEVQEIISNLPENIKSKVRLARWKDSLNNPSYVKNVESVKDEYKNNPEFRRQIIEIVKLGRMDRTERLSKMTEEEFDRLADYVLYELPHISNGVKSDGSDAIYTVLLYPGLSKLNDLSAGLSNKTMFLDLANKLNIVNKVGIIEAYTD